MLTSKNVPTLHNRTADFVVAISLGRLTPERQLYTAILNGEVLVSGSIDPETDAARCLERRGCVGTVQFVKKGQEVPYTRPQKIASLALTRNLENATHGPRSLRYVPFSLSSRSDARKAGAVGEAVAEDDDRAGWQALGVVVPLVALVGHLLMNLSGAA